MKNKNGVTSISIFLGDVFLEYDDYTVTECDGADLISGTSAHSLTTHEEEE
jgi:hypothetical protein